MRMEQEKNSTGERPRGEPAGCPSSSSRDERGGTVLCPLQTGVQLVWVQTQQLGGSGCMNTASGSTAPILAGSEASSHTFGL